MSIDKKIVIDENTTEQNRLASKQEKSQISTALNWKNIMSQKEFLENVQAHLKDNMGEALIADVWTPSYSAAITVCWDGRTTWVEDMVKSKKDWEKIYWESMKHEWIDPLTRPERLQVFWGYSGLLLWAMWSLNKKHFFSEDEIASIFEQLTTWIPKIYEHTDDHNHECKEDYCGCGHIKNLRSFDKDWENKFWLTHQLIQAHKKIVSKDNKVQVETLTDNHDEKWIIIIAWSWHNMEGWEAIYTINANKKNEQYFVVNLDAAYIILEKLAKDIDDIQRQQWLRNWTFLTEAEILNTLKAGFHDQLKDTATKLASHLFENNTVFIWHENWKRTITPKNMVQVASTLSSLNEEKNK